MTKNIRIFRSFFFTWFLIMLCARMKHIHISLGAMERRGAGQHVQSPALELQVRRFPFDPWYFNKMVLQNTLRSDVSAILKLSMSEKLSEFCVGEAMIDR